MAEVKEVLRCLSVALVVVALAACAGDSGTQRQSRTVPAGEEGGMSVIEGEVFYRERIMLRPGAELEVQLEDISRADALATVITTVTYTLDGGPPYPFSIEYDPTRIDPRMRYALRARITESGALRFTTTEYIDPFAAAPIEIMVSSVAQPKAGGTTQAARSGASEDQGDDATVWILETLEGEPAPPGAGGRPIDLQLDAAESRAAGFSGCNRYTGSFSSEGTSAHGTPIQFGPMAGTLMACPEGGDLERRYLQALGRVDAYRMEGEKLTLLAGAETVATYTTR